MLEADSTCLPPRLVFPVPVVDGTGYLVPFTNVTFNLGESVASGRDSCPMQGKRGGHRGKSGESQLVRIRCAFVDK